MSVKDRLTQKTAGLMKANLPGTEEEAKPKDSAVTSSPEVRAARTGPGQMLAFRSHMQESELKVRELESKLKQFEGSTPLQLLDPTKVCRSRWANRHASSFNTPAFQLLKREIESAGGNVQAIGVRPLKGESHAYELVFGHRRHQACLELGLPVLAMVEELTDADLFVKMDRENRARADLSPFEQGDMYRRALDEGLFPSLRMMASDLGIDPGNASKAMSIARLPSPIQLAFPSPNDIQFRWGQVLQDQLQKDPEGVIKRGEEIRAERAAGQIISASETFERLVGKGKIVKASTHELVRGSKSVGRLKRSADGSIQVTIKGGVLNEKEFIEFQKLIVQSVAK